LPVFIHLSPPTQLNTTNSTTKLSNKKKTEIAFEFGASDWSRVATWLTSDANFIGFLAARGPPEG